MSTQRPRWSKQTKMVISLLLLAFFIFLLAQFSVIIPPLIIAESQLQEGMDVLDKALEITDKATQ